MFGLSQQIMKALKTAQRFVRVGLIGAGQMGTDIVSQVSLMPSLHVMITADIDLDRAVEATAIAGHPGSSVTRRGDTRRCESRLVKRISSSRPPTTGW